MFAFLAFHGVALAIPHSALQPSAVPADRIRVTLAENNKKLDELVLWANAITDRAVLTTQRTVALLDKKIAEMQAEDPVKHAERIALYERIRSQSLEGIDRLLAQKREPRSRR